MKRRTFVRTAALSAFGLSLNPSLLPHSISSHSTIHQWMEQLITSTQARYRRQAPQGANAFRQKTAALNAYFAERGYSSDRTAYYFYHEQEQCCFYVLSLQHKRSGLHDVLIPVLSRDENDQWQHIATLTGYQLEALAKTAASLDNMETPLYKLLLPAPGPARLQPEGTFATSEGAVRTQTVVQATGTQTTIEVTQRNTILHQDTYTSKHGLTSTLI